MGDKNNNYLGDYYRSLKQYYYPGNNNPMLKYNNIGRGFKNVILVLLCCVLIASIFAGIYYLDQGYYLTAIIFAVLALSVFTAFIVMMRKTSHNNYKNKKLR